MAARTRAKKRRLKDDQLVTFTVKASRFVQQYFAQVVAGVVVLLVAVLAILFTAHVRRNAARDSEREFGLAMSHYNMRDVQTAATSFAQIVDRYGGQPAGELARFFLGRSLLAQNRYEEALDAFEQYEARASRDAPFRSASVIGKANCLEGLHNYSGAGELLERLSQTLDEKDPRYLEVLFRAASDFEKSGSTTQAIELYRRVSEKATGPLKDRAAVSLALLE
jgi:tetratricopeptide (TPR) repeat protein